MAAALVYAQRFGWRVVPIHQVRDDGSCTCRDGAECNSPGKHPRLRDWVSEATNDPAVLEAWQENWPNSNLGIATGSGSGFFALDVDPKNGGDHSLAQLIAEHGDLPDTPQQSTPSGGAHYLFRLPGFAVSNGASSFRPGLDIRGDGGQIVAAPSRTARGVYRWVRAPWHVPIAEAPEWLVSELSRIPEHAAPEDRGYFPAASPEVLAEAAEAIAQHGPAIDGQAGGLHTVHAAAILTHDFALTDEEAWPLFAEWNEGCQPPWDEDELRERLRRGRKYGKAEYGCRRELDVMEHARKVLSDWRASPDAEDSMHKMVERIRPIFERSDDARRAVLEREVKAATGFTARKLGLKSAKRSGRRVADKNDPRPIVELLAGKLSETATLAEKALIASGLPIFSRGDTLVRPVVEEVDAAHGARTTIARFATFDAVALRDWMSRSTQFHRYDGRMGELVTADPSLDLAATILSRAGQWPFPPVGGVLTTPTLRPDGTVLFTPGYDRATRLLLLSPPEMPPIPSFPTREDAERSLALIEELFSEFPFVDQASLSVALSATLTAMGRGAIPVAPAHAASASTPGTGKSYTWDIVASICIGQRCPVLAAGRNEEETEKRLGAALIAGQQLISIDNVSNGLGGDALAQLIERPIVEVRVLGRSELVRVESRATVFATGNNLQIMGDLTRRVLLARLDANTERPEFRQFKRNPVATVLAARGDYIAAALTVLRAYEVAGKPDRAPRLASFEAWSDLVRSSLIWLGRADPVETMETARAEDPLLALFRSVVATWAAHFGTGRGTARTAAEVLKIAEGYDVDETFVALKGAVLAVASNHGRPDARTFGKWLSKHRGRITAGLRLEGEADAHGHASKWWVDRHENCG